MDKEIVIKLPEEVIESAKSSPNYYPILHFETIWRAIVNGTPLPKGHGRLIDADELWDLYHSNDYDFYEALDSARTIVEAEKGEEK